MSRLRHTCTTNHNRNSHHEPKVPTAPLQCSFKVQNELPIPTLSKLFYVIVTESGIWWEEHAFGETGCLTWYGVQSYPVAFTPTWRPHVEPSCCMWNVSSSLLLMLHLSSKNCPYYALYLFWVSLDLHFSSWQACFTDMLHVGYNIFLQVYYSHSSLFHLLRVKGFFYELKGTVTIQSPFSCSKSWASSHQHTKKPLNRCFASCFVPTISTKLCGPSHQAEYWSRFPCQV